MEPDYYLRTISTFTAFISCVWLIVSFWWGKNIDKRLKDRDYTHAYYKVVYSIAIEAFNETRKAFNPLLKTTHNKDGEVFHKFLCNGTHEYLDALDDIYDVHDRYRYWFSDTTNTAIDHLRAYLHEAKEKQNFHKFNREQNVILCEKRGAEIFPELDKRIRQAYDLLHTEFALLADVETFLKMSQVKRKNIETTWKQR